jgi:serine/threonine-protein kinase
MVAYECLAGRRAFDGPNPVEVALRQLREDPDPLPPDLPDGVRRLVERSITKDPAQRIADGAALLAAVDDAAAGREPDRADTLVLPVVSADPVTQVLSPAAAGADPAAADAYPAAADAPPVGEDARPVDDEPEGRSRRRLLVPLLVALVVVAAVAAGLVVLGNSGTDPAPAGRPTTSAPAPTTSAAPTPPPAPPVVQVRLDPAEYVGRPVGQVQPQLAGLDLAVVLQAVETTDVPAGQVISLAPTGEVPVGTTITVTHAVAPPPPPPTTAPPPAEAEPTAEQGNGNGNGNDNRERRRDRERDRDRNGDGDD